MNTPESLDKNTVLAYLAIRNHPTSSFVLVIVFVLTYLLCCRAALTQAAGEPSVLNDSLRQQLLNMAKVDQEARIHMMQRLATVGISGDQIVGMKDLKTMLLAAYEVLKLLVVDIENREQLKEIVDRHGWPGRSLVGKDGAFAAWLLAQHSDLDPAFQKECLVLMEKMPDGEIEDQHVAYLTDRILVAEKKPQRYGTQFDEAFKPRPLEDPQNVDIRRAKVGLPPLDEYIQTSKAMYKEMLTSPPAAEK